MALTYEPISTTTLGGASNVSFTSIPQTYTDLRLVIVGGSDGTNSNQMAFSYNNDTAAFYSDLMLQTTGATVSTFKDTSSSRFYNSAFYTPTAGLVGLTIIDIFGYTNASIYKTAWINGNFDNNGSGRTNLGVAVWRKTSAITRVDIAGGQGANLLVAGTTLTLYGIKAA